MKRTLVYGAATAAIALALGSCATSCQRTESVETLYGPPPEVDADDDPIEDVYGPPVDVQDDSDEDQPIEALYGIPTDDELENIPVETLYGPPADDAQTETVEQESERFTPVLYGPPTRLERSDT